ncbi:HNH endonuclease [Microbacterium sp. HM58-2]|nr:HNH endonuclease [Microbacterium sp. HM58-2]
MTALADATIEQVGALGALTDSLVEIDRTISMLQAARDGMLAVGARLALQVADEAGHEDFGDLATRAVAAEFGAALRVSDRTVQRRMSEASFLVEQFPRVWQAQGAGRISAAHARVIVDPGAYLENASDRDAYAAQMVTFAEGESPNRTARMARRVAERFLPKPVDDRHKDAREHRRTWVNDLPDGMAEFSVFGPAALVHGAHDSDLDHTTDAAHGGPTTASNLGVLCRRHHVLKHHSPWHVEHLQDGLFAWTSPTGKTHIDRPPPPNTVTFTHDQPPPF